MKAAVLWERRTPLKIEEVELAEPGAGEARVRLASSGVCHSDYHHYERDTWTKLPLLLGHEGAGTVEAVGPGVTHVRPGDHVIIAFGSKCGQCYYCVRGEPYLCTPPWGTSPDDLPVRVTKGGRRIHQFTGVGSFAPYTTVFAGNCVPIRRDVPLVPAALIACGVATGFGAVANTARVEPGASVAVIGCGGVGLNVVQAARLAGAARIIAVDRQPTKLTLAEAFGATHAVNAATEDPVQRVQALTEGRGADHAFEVIGLPQTIRQAYDMLRKGGAAVIVGVPPEDAEVSFSAVSFMRTGKRVLGCAYGSTRPFVDFPRLVDLWQAGKLQIEELITRRYPLEDVNEAFRALLAGEVARSVLVYE